jgi:hypothetical protein
MSEILGPLSFAKDEEQVFLGREIAQHRDYSEETARKIDSEVNRLVTRSYERAQSVLTEYVDVLHKLAEQLLEKETILGAELDEIIRQVRPGIQLPDKPTDKEEKPQDATASAADGNTETISRRRSGCDPWMTTMTPERRRQARGKTPNRNSQSNQSRHPAAKALIANQTRQPSCSPKSMVNADPTHRLRITNVEYWGNAPLSWALSTSPPTRFQTAAIFLARPCHRPSHANDRRGADILDIGGESTRPFQTR